MMKYQVPRTFSWLGHAFHVNKPDAPLSTASGLYIFARLHRDWRGTLLWRALYVGKADNFSIRLHNHERWEEANLLGLTHIHIHVEKNALRRSLIERELIKAVQPLLNVQLK